MVVEFEEAPFAISDVILGLLVVIKFPQIFLNAKAISGPTFGGVGPKSGDLCQSTAATMQIR